MKKRMIALLAGTAILCSLIGCTPAEPQQTENSTPETTQAALTHNHQADNNKEWMPWTSTDSLPGQADG